jgi:hypothetical protein
MSVQSGLSGGTYFWSDSNGVFFFHQILSLSSDSAQKNSLGLSGKLFNSHVFPHRSGHLFFQKLFFVSLHSQSETTEGEARKIVAPDKWKKEKMTQKSKKKTVKELNDDFIAFEEKFKSMEMMINHLNAKVALLESKKEEHLQTLGDKDEKEVKEFVCKICDSKFPKCRTLKVHMKEQHKKEIKCRFCDEKNLWDI